MKKIGVSIPWDYLSGNIVTKESEILFNNYGNPQLFLRFLKDLRVTHIELRHRKKDITPMDMENVFQLLSDFNFKISIHGDNPLPGKSWTINEVFPWLDLFKKVFPNHEDHTMITLHPVTGSESEIKYREQTIDFIRRLDEFIIKDNLNIKLALENQRRKKICDPGKSFLEIEGMWKEINRSNVGICWDMGHCVANYLMEKNTYPLYPDDNFAAATIHTHIHDIGPNGRTHWIFKENKVPVAGFTEQLKATGYDGVYNLELSFNRFADEKNQKELLKESILYLREMI